jgi:hypothetical protein
MIRLSSLSLALALALALALPAVSTCAGAQTTLTDSASKAFDRADWAEASRLYARALVESPGFQPLQVRLRLARIAAVTGKPDIAFNHLDEAAKLRLSPRLLESTKDFDRIRSDPRYPALMERVTAARYPCRAGTVFHQLDFWIGEWNVSPWAQTGGNPASAGFNRVTAMLDRCGILEEWAGTAGDYGKSINFYDNSRAKWRQIWIADNGSSLDYEGTFTGGAMRFEGWTKNAAGNRVLQKLTFFPIAADTVRQLFESSIDDGKTWTPGFDARYVRKK